MSAYEYDNASLSENPDNIMNRKGKKEEKERRGEKRKKEEKKRKLGGQLYHGLRMRLLTSATY